MCDSLMGHTIFNAFVFWQVCPDVRSCVQIAPGDVVATQLVDEQDYGQGESTDYFLITAILQDALVRSASAATSLSAFDACLLVGNAGTTATMHANRFTVVLFLKLMRR